MIGTQPDTYRKLVEAGNIAAYLMFPLVPLLPPGPLAQELPTPEQPDNVIAFPPRPQLQHRIIFSYQLPQFAVANIDAALAWLAAYPVSDQQAQAAA